MDLSEEWSKEMGKSELAQHLNRSDLGARKMAVGGWTRHRGEGGSGSFLKMPLVNLMNHQEYVSLCEDKGDVTIHLICF